MKDIYVKNFSEFPGPRKESIGPNSGERFRDEVLYKAIEDSPSETFRIHLDGTAGYGSSFLEEAFGGLVRLGVSEQIMRGIIDNLVSEEDPSLIVEVSEYIDDAIQALKE
ncbi:STAS-like domain-containing protein [Pseudomonas sp. TWRC1-2]|uniref:STAS-like domain-containing protein n=1 Tax=Pseudomonas sp. TWRC1-2 TaxID=2804628 RepID=UPI003CF8AB71